MLKKYYIYDINLLNNNTYTSNITSVRTKVKQHCLDLNNSYKHSYWRYSKNAIIENIIFIKNIWYMLLILGNFDLKIKY